MAKNGKKSKTETEIPGLKIISVDTLMVPVDEFVDNSAQSRGMGIFSKLGGEGYGLFERKGVNKKSIWEMLHSDKEEQRSAALTLLEEHEGEESEDRQKKLPASGGNSLWALAKDLHDNPAGLLQPILAWDTGDGFDCIAGARRLVSYAINKALYPDEDRWGEIETRVFKFDGTPSPLALRLMARSENKIRRGESPLDRAMSFSQDMKDGGYTIAQYSRIVGFSEQYISDYTKRLLDKRMKEFWPKIHSGEWTVDKALRKYRSFSKEAEAKREDSNGTRDRWPSAKATVKTYNLKKKPEEMSDEEWTLWTSPDVRKLIALTFHVEYSEWEPGKPEEEKPAEKAEPEGKATKPGGGKIIRIPRLTAQLLLVGLGKTDARTYDDAKLKEKLESLPNLIEDGTPELDDATLEKVKNRLLEAYREDLNVEIIDGKYSGKGKAKAGAAAK